MGDKTSTFINCHLCLTIRCSLANPILIRALRRPRHHYENSWAPPPQIYNGRRAAAAAADNMAARRRCHDDALNCFLPFHVL